MRDKELMIELSKNKADEIVVKQELEKSKNDFINEIKYFIGDEIKSGYYNKPVKYKKPFRIKFNNFINRIKSVLGWN